MRRFCSGGTRSHSRTISGPWLAAKAPTRLAMVKAPDELVVLHADGEEVVAQEVGIGARREERRIVLGDRLLHALIERIARQHLVALGAEFGGQRGGLQVDDELREPVVAQGLLGLDAGLLGERLDRGDFAADERVELLRRSEPDVGGEILDPLPHRWRVEHAAYRTVQLLDERGWQVRRREDAPPSLDVD